MEKGIKDEGINKLDSHRYNPLRYRSLLLLSIGTGYISKIFINVFFVSLVFAKPYA